MNNFSLLRSLLLVFAAVFMASCDTDYNQLGSDVVSADIHNSIVPYQGHVVAYNKATGPVQTNGLALNLLGAYNNPVFGKTKASYVTQLSLNSVVPDINGTAVVDSAWIYIPYYSTLTNTKTILHENRNETRNIYTIDSIYGDTLSKLRFSIRENGYFLRGYEAGGTDAQKYYSDQAPTFRAAQGPSLLDPDLYPNGTVDSVFSRYEILRRANYTHTDGSTTTGLLAEQLSPGFFAYLDKAYFTNKILHAPSGVLANDNVFQNYMRGLFIEAEPMNGASVAGMPKFESGYIKIVYTQDNMATADLTDKESITLTINLSGSKVNVFENTLNSVYSSAVTAANPVAGDSRLYVKGGEGSMALLDILSTDDINFLRSEKAIINEANLTFYVDRSIMGVTGPTGRQPVEPMRVYLYDVNNKRPVYDYYTDGTSSTTYPKYSKYVYGGLLEVDNSLRGIKYKLRVTDHVNNVINKDSTNIKLGLVVTETINTVTNSYLKNPFTDGTIPVEGIPTSAIMHPFGTVLYGTNVPASEEPYRLKLEIFYTKPEE